MINLDSRKKLKKWITYISVACSLLLFMVLIFKNNDEAHAEKNNILSQTFKVEKSKNYEIALNKASQSKIISAGSNDLQKLEVVNNDIESILKVKVKAFAINVDGENLAIFKTKDEATILLDNITKPFIENNDVKIENVKFKERVKIVETTANMKELDGYDEMLYYITKGTNETKIHKVEKGENYWVIAEKYNIGSDTLIKANPDVNPDAIQIGQEISLVVPKPFVTVVTTEIKEYKEQIEFDTEYEETSTLYKGEYRIKKNGEKGERQIKAEIIKENGIEANRNILDEKIMKEPVTKLVLKGTKKVPPKIGTGSFSKPTNRGTLTSPFGYRWGKRHTGIDIGMPTGTPVKAADGGKVVFADWNGAYGKCIMIDHGGNTKTYYAHLNNILVKKGDKVFKGQKIAESGNTGRSTGPHLHFEVRKNGTPVNPNKYVKY